MKVSALGFSLYPVLSQEDLFDACKVRAKAYAHHVPEIAGHLNSPDEIDHHPGTTVFICRDKTTGCATGSMRIQTTEYGPLSIEEDLRLPGWLGESTRAEITRLAVPAGVDTLTRLCLWKASFLFCISRGMRWMVIGARSEALVRNYRRLGFADVFPGIGEVPLAHTGGVPHRIMAFDASDAKRSWADIRHPLYEFIFETVHPDIDVLGDFVPGALRPLRAAA